MVKTIGNPLSWGAQILGAVGSVFGNAVDGLRNDNNTAAAVPQVRTLAIDDLMEALNKGFRDFTTFRTDVMFLVVIYPVIGMLLAWMATDAARLPMLFPLISGFALLGPVAAVGLYEMSRRKETGQSARWGDAFGVFQSPALAPILALGVYLFGIFIVWLAVANAIYAATLGPEPPASMMGFIMDVITTGPGWMMAIIGCGVGFVFAAVVLATSLVSFPMLLDRHCGLPLAVVTSINVARKNPRVTAIWGMIVAGSLALGSLPFFLGLIIVMPVLGHATWHLYRRAVVFEN